MKRRFALLAAPVVALASVGGCALVEPQTSEEALSPLAQCALGSEWQLDLEDLAAQVQTMLQRDGVNVTAVTAAGSQHLDWTEQGHVTLEVDYAIEATMPGPAEGQVFTVTETSKGTVTGRAFINGTVAIPRNWDTSDLETDRVATLDGAEQEVPPFLLPPTLFDDGLGLVTSCEGDELTLQQRGRDLVQHWSRAN